MTSAARRLDPDLELFRHHLPGFPAVPGVLLLADYAASLRTGDQPRPNIILTGVQFAEFVFPGESFSHRLTETGRVQIVAGDRLRCWFDDASSTSSPDRRRACADLDEQAAVRTVRPLRPQEFWFLPPQLRIDAEAGAARCRIDLRETVAALPYLRQTEGWELLVLIECLGNLALALQHATTSDDPLPPYVFAKFGELSLHAGEPYRNDPVIVETRLRRRGSILVWDGSVHDEHGGTVLLSVRNGVSTVRRSP
ncbi:hypothetical protein ABZX66_18440 [Micromonospora aurantiaca]|uniref:hypothetical protein n=1 Tax=Micromonospora aurantiaca (nom. illeg.) TaxID=47850 RepID=UPI0033B62C21